MAKARAHTHTRTRTHTHTHTHTHAHTHTPQLPGFFSFPKFPKLPIAMHKHTDTHTHSREKKKKKKQREKHTHPSIHQTRANKTTYQYLWKLPFFISRKGIFLTSLTQSFSLRDSRNFRLQYYFLRLCRRVFTESWARPSVSSQIGDSSNFTILVELLLLLPLQLRLLLELSFALLRVWIPPVWVEFRVQSKKMGILKNFFCGRYFEIYNFFGCCIMLYIYRNASWGLALKYIFKGIIMTSLFITL